MRLHVGDQVMVVPTDKDPLILHMQRLAVIESRTDEGYMVRLEDARPQVYGPIPESRLLLGWRDESGRFRRW
jgi:hypothetical protein